MGAQLSYLYSTISYVYPTLKYGTYALSSYLTFLLLRFYIYDRTYEKEPPPKSMSKTVLKKIRGKGKVQESLKFLNKNIIFGNCWPRDYFSLSLSLNVCVLIFQKGDFIIFIPCISKEILLFDEMLKNDHFFTTL